jgi:hypothetical protein
MKLIWVVLLFIFSALSVNAETDSTITSDSNVTSTGTMDTTVRSPPPSAIAPQISGSNSDLCTIGVAGAVQTQILGISAGKTVRDMNCEKLKNAKVMYDMGMKVAAVSVMCQDKRVFDAMMNAGTPCPKDGLIGDAARLAWEADTTEKIEGFMDAQSDTTLGFGAVLGVLGLLLLL